MASNCRGFFIVLADVKKVSSGIGCRLFQFHFTVAVALHDMGYTVKPYRLRLSIKYGDRSLRRHLMCYTGSIVVLGPDLRDLEHCIIIILLMEVCFSSPCYAWC